MSFRFSKDKWLVLLAVVCGISMIFLDATILPVALPTIQKELGVSTGALQWVINIYFLVDACFVIFGGKLGDIFGIRRMFIIGLLIFGIASVMGGFAPGWIWLLAARALQGFGAALLAPLSSAITVHNFPQNQRGKALGMTVSAGSVFLALGPFVGGFFTEYFSWRWVFFINIFISFIGVFLTMKYVPKIPSRRVKIDFVALLLFVGALFLITLGVMEGDTFGWTSMLNTSFFLIGLTFAFLFYFHYRNHKTKEPFFDFSLFKNINFLIGAIHIFIVGFLLMNTIFWTIFFQRALGFSPSVAGFWVFLSTAPTIIAAPLAGYLMDKVGVKLPTTLGFIGHILTFLSVLLFAIYDYFPIVIIGMIIYGFSVSMVMTPTFSFVISSAPVEKRGLVSGVISTMRFIGATFGLAILGSIYSGVMTKGLDQYLLNQKVSKPKFEIVKEIYLDGKEDSVSGVKISEIKESSKASAFESIKTISIFSLVLSVSGMLLIYGEHVRKRKIKRVSL